MAITALSLGKVRDYVSKYDNGEDPTTWKLGTLSSRAVGSIRDSVTSVQFSAEDLEKVGTDRDVVTSVNRSKMHVEAVRRGLKGFENFLHPDTGEPVNFKFSMRDIDGTKQNVVPYEILDLIPMQVIEELSDQIMGDNELSERETGNSQEPSSDG